MLLARGCLWHQNCQLSLLLLKSKPDYDLDTTESDSDAKKLIVMTLLLKSLIFASVVGPTSSLSDQYDEHCDHDPNAHSPQNGQDIPCLKGLILEGELDCTFLRN